MTLDQYESALVEFGLTDNQVAADFFGVARRTAQNWRKGETLIPKSVALAIALMQHSGINCRGAETIVRDAGFLRISNKVRPDGRGKWARAPAE
jgi:hypothetical protein